MSEPVSTAVKIAILKRFRAWRGFTPTMAAVGIGATIFLALFATMLLEHGNNAVVPVRSDSMPVKYAAARAVAYDLAPVPMLAEQRAGSGGAVRAAAYVPSQPMLARKAGLILAVKDLLEARSALEAKLAARGGYIASLQAADRRDAARELQAVLRVPADQLAALLTALKSLGRVEGESSRADEVTQQYVDLTARLHNSRNTEQRLIDVLRTRTGKVADVLEVEQEIARVREEIERMDAERKHLEGRVSHASIELRMFEDYRAELTLAQPSPARQLWNSLVEGLKRAAGGVFALANFTLQYLPALLMWAVVLFWPVRAAVRRVRTTQRPVEKAA